MTVLSDRDLRDVVLDAFLARVPADVIEQRVPADLQDRAHRLYSTLAQAAGHRTRAIKVVRRDTSPGLTLSECWRYYGDHSFTEMASWPCWGINEDTPAALSSIIRAYTHNRFRYRKRASAKRNRKMKRGPCCMCKKIFWNVRIVRHAWTCKPCLDVLRTWWLVAEEAVA